MHLVILFFLLLAFITFTVLVLTKDSEGARLRERRKRFENRESMSLEEIFNQYYINSNINKLRFKRIWNDVADILQLDAQKLRPSDRFDTELAPVKGYHLEDEQLVDLEECIMMHCQKRNINMNQYKLDTLDDIIRLLVN